MKSFITFAACSAVSFPSAIAASNATTTTSANTLSTSAATACGISTAACLSCDQHNITDASGTSYQVFCDYIISSTDQYAVTNAQAISTARLCMQACDDFNGCIGAYYSPGSCVLATGTLEGTLQDPGYTAFLRNAATSLPSSSAASARLVSSTRAHTTASGATATSVLTIPTAGGGTNTSSGCQATAIGCPSCDGEAVVDSRGKTYKVYCDYQLFADSDYSVQRWTSPSGCLLECDNYSWCKGATFWPQGNCELAKGSNVFPQEMPGYTAFSPVAGTATPTSQTSPSRFPTGTSTPVRSTGSRSALTFETVTLAGPSTVAATPTCTPSAARCPICDGVTTKDALNQTYTITCASEPICQDVVNAGTAFSQGVCLGRCDADPICFAALWNNTQCHLCEGAIDGLIAFDAPADVDDNIKTNSYQSLQDFGIRFAIADCSIITAEYSIITTDLSIITAEYSIIAADFNIIAAFPHHG